jgi:hypothetical protein
MIPLSSFSIFGYTLTTKYMDLAFKKYISSTFLVIENFKEHIISIFFFFTFSFWRNYASKKMLGTTRNCRIIAALSLTSHNETELIFKKHTAQIYSA